MSRPDKLTPPTGNRFDEFIGENNQLKLWEMNF